MKLARVINSVHRTNRSQVSLRCEAVRRSLSSNVRNRFNGLSLNRNINNNNNNNLIKNNRSATSSAHKLMRACASVPNFAHTKRCASSGTNDHYRVLVVGGGTAGLAIANQLHNLAKKNGDKGKKILGKVGIIEPSDNHYYQAGWTLVGGGLMDQQQTLGKTNDYIPAAVTRISDRVSTFEPEMHTVTTEKSGKISYDYMVVCPGLQLNWNKVKGLPALLADRDANVTSNYSFETAPKTASLLQSALKNGGNAVFTQPSTPIKCGGAPQKAMYLAEAAARKNGWRQNLNFVFATGMDKLFPAPKYCAALEELAVQRGIERRLKTELVAVEKDVAHFRDTANNMDVSLPFSFLHAVPPMSAPDFIAQSPLANPAGYVHINDKTLQHVKFPTIFGLGDASSLPTSKTAAAITCQSYVVQQNLWAELSGETDGALEYDGYTACPITTGDSQVIMAEFTYGGKPRETFDELLEGMLVKQNKPNWLMFLAKRYGMPFLYWNGLLTGKWMGIEEYMQRDFPIL